LILFWLNTTVVKIRTKKYEKNTAQSKVLKFDCMDNLLILLVDIISKIVDDILCFPYDINYKTNI